jgi:hypothetical protein
MKILVAFIFILILFFGCIGNEAALKAERDAYAKQASDATAKVSELETQCSLARSSLSKCTQDYDALSQQCGQTGTSCAALQDSYDILSGEVALVKNNISELAPYRNAEALYFEVIKSGKIPGYSRLMAADKAVNATGDVQLMDLWKSARDCPRRGGDCTLAYGPFETYLNAKIGEFVAKIITSANS